MAMSLTREEFLQRLEERKKLFKTALKYDLKELESHPDRPRYMVKLKDREVELHEFIGNLINDAIFRAIDIVYEDSL